MAVETGAAPALVRAVAGSVVGDTFRAWVRRDKPAALVFLCAELEQCVRSYTGCVGNEESDFEEMAVFFMDRFGDLNAGELREAFRLGAAGELGELDMRAYHGIFSIVALGDVLTAYRAYRSRIVNACAKAEREAAEAKRQAERAEQYDPAAWLTSRLARLKTMDPLDVNDCTVYDYDQFTREGLLQVTDEQKREAWTDALQAVYTECREGAGDSITMRRMLQKVAAGGDDDGFQAKRIAYAKRLLVYRWITGLLK